MSRCYFKDICTFEFVGDSITKATNIVLKVGRINATTNMTINQCDTIPVKIGEYQNHRKNTCFVGNSITKATNIALKVSRISATTNMTINQCDTIPVKISEYQNHRKNK